MGTAPGAPTSSFPSAPHASGSGVCSQTSPEPGQRNDLFLYSPFHLSSVHQKATIHLSMHQLKKTQLHSAWQPLRLALSRGWVFSRDLELNLFGLSKSSLRCDLITVCKYLPREKTARY